AMLDDADAGGVEEAAQLDRRERRRVIGLLARAARIRDDLEVVDLRPVERERSIDDAGVDLGGVDRLGPDRGGWHPGGALARARGGAGGGAWGDAERGRRPAGAGAARGGGSRSGRGS